MTNIINFPFKPKKPESFLYGTGMEFEIKDDQNKFKSSPKPIEDPHVFTLNEGRTLFSWGFYCGIIIGIIVGLIFGWILL